MAILKRQTGMRLNPETDKLIDLLKADTGLTATGIVELAIRDLAKARGVGQTVTHNQTKVTAHEREK